MSECSDNSDNCEVLSELVLSEFYDYCQNCLFLQSYCQIVLVIVQIMLQCSGNFELLSIVVLLSGTYNCWQLVELLLELSVSWTCCQSFLNVVRMFYLLSEFSDCWSCCQSFLIVVRNFCGVCLTEHLDS